MWFNFHGEFFFLFLLPPIILYPNFPVFCFLQIFHFLLQFTLIGYYVLLSLTFLCSLSRCSVSHLYLGGLIYLTYRLPFVQCLMFGALISATDPVTVLSIFRCFTAPFYFFYSWF
ncbi:unnamed protein product [Prunus brigantina]